MSYEWSLDVFYKGIDDPNLAADMAKLEEKTAAYKQLVNLNHKSISAEDFSKMF